MKFRRVLFWIHLTAGVVAGLVILVMSVTGALLTFQQSVLRAVERPQRYVDVPEPAAPRVPLETVLANVRGALPGAEPATVTLEADSRSTIAVGLGPAGTAFVHPYTGDVLGQGALRARSFYRSVTNWHRYLAMSGERRATGRAITGACNAAFLVLAVSGLYLWWPRQWTRRHLAPVTWFRRGVQGRARDFNWHNVIGLWCAPVLIVLTTTAMVISYPWASNLLYRVTGSPLPAATAGAPAQGRQPSQGAGQSSREAGSARGVDNREGGAAARVGSDRMPPGAVSVGPAPLDDLLDAATRQVPTWSMLALRLPAKPGAPVAVTITDGAHWNRFARSTLTLDSRTGASLKWEPYAATSAGQKLRGWMRFAHTGELGGPVGEALAGLASVGGGFLVWTGLALSLRRFAAWRARAGSRASAAAPSAVSGLQN
jgi:uncharacterized iron-regulated membrane protein